MSSGGLGYVAIEEAEAKNVETNNKTTKMSTSLHQTTFPIDDKNNRYHRPTADPSQVKVRSAFNGGQCARPEHLPIHNLKFLLVV